MYYSKKLLQDVKILVIPQNYFQEKTTNGLVIINKININISYIIVSILCS